MTRRDSPRPQPVATMAREANPSCERQPRRGRGVLRRDPDRHGAGLLRRHQTPATASRQRAAAWTAAPTVGVVGYDAVESGRRAPNRPSRRGRRRQPPGRRTKSGPVDEPTAAPARTQPTRRGRAAVQGHQPPGLRVEVGRIRIGADRAGPLGGLLPSTTFTLTTCVWSALPVDEDHLVAGGDRIDVGRRTLRARREHAGHRHPPRRPLAHPRLWTRRGRRRRFGSMGAGPDRARLPPARRARGHVPGGPARAA
jgi:hypothetical protein